MDWLLIVQIIVALTLTLLVLIQQQGTGLGRTWGGGSGQYRSKKGLERGLFIMTISTGVLFAVISLVNIIF